MVNVPKSTGPRAQAGGTLLPATQGVRQTAQGATSAAFGGQAAAATGNVGDAVARIGGQTAEVAVKLQERKNAREIMKQYSQYQAGIAELYRNTKDGMDLTDAEVPANFNAELQRLRQEAIEANQGGPIAASQLDKLLAEAQSGFSMKMVDDVQKAHDAEAEQIDAAESNRLFQITFNNPTLMADARAQAVALAEVANAGSSPQVAAARTRRFESAVLKGGLEGLLSQGAWKQVGRILRDNPDAAAILGEEAFTDILNKMARLESGVDKEDISISITEETEEAFHTTFGKGVAEIGLEAIRKAERSQEALVSLAIQRDLVASQRLEPGAFTDFRQHASRVAELLGLEDAQLLKMLKLGDPAASDAFDAETNKQVSLLVQEGSRITNLFIQTIAGRVPQLYMTEEGLDTVIQLREWVHNTVIQEAEIWTRHADPAYQSETSVHDDLAALREQKRTEFADISKSILANTGDDKPASWREVVKQGIESGQAPEQPEVSEEDMSRLRLGVQSKYAGWEFSGFTDDGRVKIKHLETGNEGATDLSLDDFLASAGEISDATEEAAAEAGEEEEADSEPTGDDTAPF